MRRFIDTVNTQVMWLCVKFAAHTCYVAGITLLLPIIFLWLNPPPDGVSLRAYTVIGVSLVILSIGLLRRWTKSFADVFIDLGWTTIIPGLIAIVLAFFSRDLLLAWLQPLPASATFTPWLVAYVDEAVPTAWLITGLYLALGVTLIGYGIIRNHLRGRVRSQGFSSQR